MGSGLFSSSGSTQRTQMFLKKMSSSEFSRNLDALAQQGLNALAAATPIDSGITAASWSYEIERTSSRTTISWLNTHRENGVNIAVILQYGHGTGTGGYVAGRDYINPAIKPIFDQIADDVWKQVTLA